MHISQATLRCITDEGHCCIALPARAIWVRRRRIAIFSSFRPLRQVEMGQAEGLAWDFRQLSSTLTSWQAGAAERLTIDTLITDISFAISAFFHAFSVSSLQRKECRKKRKEEKTAQCVRAAQCRVQAAEKEYIVYAQRKETLTLLRLLLIIFIIIADCHYLILLIDYIDSFSTLMMLMISVSAFFSLFSLIAFLFHFHSLSWHFRQPMLFAFIFHRIRALPAG